MNSIKRGPVSPHKSGNRQINHGMCCQEEKIVVKKCKLFNSKKKKEANKTLNLKLDKSKIENSNTIKLSNKKQNSILKLNCNKNTHCI